MDEKNEELLELFKSGTDRIQTAKEAYLTACREESIKLSNFFKENKNEIAVPFNKVIRPSKYSFVNTKAYRPEDLTRCIEFSGWNGRAFSLKVKGSETVQLTEDIIKEFVFIDDDGKELLELVNKSIFSKNDSYNNMLVNGKYAVMIYPQEYMRNWNKKLPEVTQLAIYIGKIFYDKNFYGGPIFMHKPNEKGRFQVEPTWVVDSVVFDNPDDFNAYVSKHHLNNGQPLSEGENPSLTQDCGGVK